MMEVLNKATPMTYGPGYPTAEDRTMPAVVYALCILGLFHGLTLIIGVIMAYVLRGGAGPASHSHYTYVIRTFWISLIWAVIGGGVMLVKTPEELTILEVVNAVEPIVRIETCPLGLKSHGKRLCPLHRRMDEALESIEKSFRGTTLADLLAEPTDSHPLCDLPKKPRTKNAEPA